LLFLLLRDMGVIWSKFRYDNPGEEINTLKANGKMIYNILSIFYDSQWITGVIWALYEIGDEAQEIYDELGLGFGINNNIIIIIPKISY